MKITKKALSVLLSVATLFSLSGCKSDETVESSEPSSPVQSSPSPRPTHVPHRIQASSTSDLVGQWEQFDSEFPGLHQVAIICGDIIEIYWINEETDTQYLYWSGSFPASDSIESSYSWVSENNMERTELSPLASWDETKDFTFEDGQISYSASSVGITATVRLEMNTWKPDLATDEFYENGTFPFSVAGIEFLVPDFFKEDESKAAKKSTVFVLYHGQSGCPLSFFEYDITPQNFEDEKWTIIESYTGENAEKINTQDITIADFPGTAFSYHTINQNNVSLNVYGTLIYNPREEKAVLVAFFLPREENYQKFFTQITESATRKSLVGDIKWDLAFEHGTKTSTEYYLVDFDDGIAIRYVRGRGRKVNGIYVGKASGSLDDMLDIAFKTTDGGETHDYFTWKYPDKESSNLISKLNEKGEEDYFTYSETSVDTAVDDVKYYIIRQ